MINKQRFADVNTAGRTIQVTNGKFDLNVTQ
jgi:hypothetical protein